MNLKVSWSAMSDESQSTCRHSFLTERYSASNEAARAAEQERIWAMTPYERIALAFALGCDREALQALGDHATAQFT